MSLPDSEEELPRAYEVLEALSRAERALITIPDPEPLQDEEICGVQLPVAPISVNRTGWEAVVRQEHTAPEGSPNVRVYLLSAAQGEEHLECYHITDEYGATFIGNVLSYSTR
mgnify:CR=1 FL=1